MRPRVVPMLIGVGVLPAAAALAQSFAIPWWTIEGGGRASGGTFELHGVIGQPDAGDAMAGGAFELRGGFLVGFPASVCPADVDDGLGAGVRDGAVTIDDLLYFLEQFEGGSVRADLDDDGQDPAQPDGGVTIEDLLFFLAHFQQGC